MSLRSRFLRSAGPTLASLVLIASACKKLNNFDVQQTGSATIPAGTIIDNLLAAFPFTGFDSISFSQSFKNQGVTADEIDSVKVDSFILDTTSPQGATFDFIDSITFYANANGLPEVKIAEMKSVPKGTTQISLDIPNVELKPYAVAPQMTIRTEAKGHRPNQDTTLKADIHLSVDFHIPGCSSK